MRAKKLFLLKVAFATIQFCNFKIESTTHWTKKYFETIKSALKERNPIFSSLNFRAKIER